MTRQDILREYGLIVVGTLIALVDKQDYEAAKKYAWRLNKSANGRLSAVATYKDASGLRTYYLHHLVAIRANGPRPSMDHVCKAVNGDTLDCRRANLIWRQRTEVWSEAANAAKAAKRA